MRLVRGVWKKTLLQLGIEPQTSHFPGECANSLYKPHSIRTILNIYQRGKNHLLHFLHFEFQSSYQLRRLQLYLLHQYVHNAVCI